MTKRRTDRRASRRFAAAFITMAVLATACSDSDGSAPDDANTATTPVGIPDHHELSSNRVAEVVASTVGISGVACGRLASGSGFAISDDLIVTNAHVILGIDEILVHTFDGRELVGVPVAFDADADLAILEVAGASLDPLTLASDTNVGTVGMLVGWEPGFFADPTPFRIDRRVTVRIETVGGTERIERRSWLLAAEVELGDSGAALVDSRGAVVGVAFATSRQSANVGYAIRASEVDELRSRGRDLNLIVPGC